VQNPDLKQWEGKTVADVAKAWKKSPEDTLMDFVLADNAQTGAIYFIASEEDLKTGLSQPWTSIGLDSNEMSLDGPRLSNTLIPVDSAPCRASSAITFATNTSCPSNPPSAKSLLSRQREHLADRGLLKPGYFADLTIFDPTKSSTAPPTTSSSTIRRGRLHRRQRPNRIRHGKLTGATAGHFLRGRAWHQSPN